MRTGRAADGRKGADQGTALRGRNAKDGRELPELVSDKQGVSSLGEPERARPCQHLDVTLLASRGVRGYISVVLSHPVLNFYDDATES